jgi:hypothetical protein
MTAWDEPLFPRRAMLETASALFNSGLVADDVPDDALYEAATAALRVATPLIADARWQALKDYLAERISGDEAVRTGMVADGEHELSAPFGGLVSANRSTLAKMRELEAGK